MSHPETRRDDVVEDLHGHQIADPYRWLEDPDDPEVVDWVERQRAHADSVWATIGEREWFTQTMRTIVKRPHRSAPWRDNGWYFQTRNDGSQQQDVLFAATTLDDLLAGGRQILDPNTFSADGTSSLASLAVSPDGTLLAYAVSAGGSDWTTQKFIDLTTFTERDDQLVTRFAAGRWLPDSASVLYTVWPDAGDTVGTNATALSAPQLWLYRLGGEKSELLRYDDDPAVMFGPQVFAAREGGSATSWLTVEGYRGTERTNRLWIAPITEVGGRSEVGEWITVFDNDDEQRDPIGIVDEKLLLQTHQDAVRGQVMAIDLTDPLDLANLAAEPTTVIAEPEGTLEFVRITASALVSVQLVDVSPVLTRHRLDGSVIDTVALNVGAITGLNTERDHDEVFISSSSVAEPGQAWRLDAATGEVTPIDDPDALPELPVTTLRLRATSADGAHVPYWVISRADLAGEGETLNGPRPALIYGYGGFTIPVQADYRPGWRGWLQAGGVLVITNLRGGGEFGQEWYDQGRRDHKQNVFNDFIACAEDVIERGITTAAQLTCYGRSNGGLLVGAAITQRPDLYGAALPQVGVLDLLRFHTFTIGAAWISDYGDPRVAGDFETVLAYSPLHQVKPGTAYPPTLVVTGDHDDRVVPAHSHKFTATMQAAQSGDAPVVTRIEPATGHGAGKPAQVIADEWADLLAWAAHFTGLTVG